MNLIEGYEAKKHGATTIGIRPEHIDVTPDGAWHGVVGLSEHLGSDTFLKVNAGDLGTLTLRASGEISYRHGDAIRFAPQDGKLMRFGADGKARS